jgi:hypothetical protein
MADAARENYWCGTRCSGSERLILLPGLHPSHRTSWCHFILPNEDLKTLRELSSDERRA